MRITDDLVQELLSHGSRITIEEPRELRMRMYNELKKNIEAYESKPTYAGIVRKKQTLPVTDLDVIENLRKGNKISKK